MMSEKLDWTQKLGDAFLSQQKDVMNTIQSLRAKAQASGNLKTTKEQVVIVEQKTAYDAKRFNIKMPKEVPMTTQERAYTSPIWYTPSGK